MYAVLESVFSHSLGREPADGSRPAGSALILQICGLVEDVSVILVCGSVALRSDVTPGRQFAPRFIRVYSTACGKCTAWVTDLGTDNLTQPRVSGSIFECLGQRVLHGFVTEPATNMPQAENHRCARAGRRGSECGPTRVCDSSGVTKNPATKAGFFAGRSRIYGG